MAAAPTVVSAYYPLPNMHDHQTYLKWIDQFWPKMACNLVWFTVPPLVRLFERLFKLKTNVKVIGLPMEQFDAHVLLNPLLWKKAAQKNGEDISPELCVIHYEKKAFVRRAIELNPFGSETFVWCDADVNRNPAWVPAVASLFPIDAHIPREKMLILQTRGIHVVEEDPPFSCSVLASDRAGWQAWNRTFDRICMKQILAGNFRGTDQEIATAIGNEDPGLLVRLSPPPYLGGDERKSYLLFFLGGVAVRQA
jgi:hypothetical protein